MPAVETFHFARTFPSIPARASRRLPPGRKVRLPEAAPLARVNTVSAWLLTRGLSVITATSPVGVPPPTLTEVFRVTEVPCANEVVDGVKVVVVAVPLLRLFQLVTSTLASIEPRPVARS